MKFRARLAVVLTMARFVEPQGYPSCGVACINDIASTIGSEFCGVVLCCLYKHCADSDLKDAEKLLGMYCRGNLSEIVCSTAASSSDDTQSTEPPEPEQSSVTGDGSTATAESSRATANSGGSETAANSASEPSSLPTSNRSGDSAGSNSGTTGNDHALTLKLGLGLGIGLGVPLLAAVVYLAFLQGKKHKGQGTPNNQQPRISSYQDPPPQGYPPPGYMPSSHLPQSYSVPGPPPQVQSQQGRFDPHKSEHEGSAGGAGGNMNQHEMMGNIPPLRHELHTNIPPPHSELPPDTRPHKELP